MKSFSTVALAVAVATVAATSAFADNVPPSAQQNTVPDEATAAPVHRVHHYHHHYVRQPVAAERTIIRHDVETNGR